jgi:Tfp pilus assembly PilM family ATPase
MSFLSIDIGTNSIAIVQGTVGPGIIGVSLAETTPLKSGTVINSSIRDQVEVVSAITNAIQRRSFSETKAIVTISPANALIREFSVPAGKPKQVEAIVRNEMIATYGAADSDVVEYLKLVDEASESGGKLIKVRALALHMDMVSGYHDAITAAKLKPSRWISISTPSGNSWSAGRRSTIWT